MNADETMAMLLPVTPAPNIEIHHPGTPVNAAPRLAVVITCFNYAAFVGRAIDSVTSQGHPDCEVIVVDDGSTDGSWAAITARTVRAFRIGNSGQREACLFGLGQTRAPFILFLDADDEMRPGSLARLMPLLTPDVAKVQFSLAIIDGEGHPIGGPHPDLSDAGDGRLFARSILRTGCYKTPPTSGNVFRRDVCLHLQDSAYERAVDGIILMAAPFMGAVISLPEELGSYRIHDRNDSGLGRAPDAAFLARDLARFVDRMGHLRRILTTAAPGHDLVDPHETFFYRDRSFCRDVALGRHPGFADMPALLASLWREPSNLRLKLALALFFGMTSLLPLERAQAALSYRLSPGTRSIAGMLRAVVRPPAQGSSAERIAS